MTTPDLDRLREIEAERRARDRSRWIRFSLVPMIFVLVVVFVGTSVAVTTVHRQDVANQMVLDHLTRDSEQIIQIVVALSDASANRQHELALRQEAILCVQAILPQDRTKANVARCLAHLPAP